MFNALKRGIFGIALVAAGLAGCEKTKFKTTTPQPTPAAPAPTTAAPSAKSPDETNNSGNARPAPEMVNPQPTPYKTPIMGGVPPKPGTTETVPGLGDKPVLTVPPKVPFPPVSTGPSIPPNKVPVQLRVAQLNYEAWWKNCLIVSIGSDTKEVGCNKTTPLNTVVEFLADKGVCNRMEVRVQTFFPVAGACKAGQPCNGPYNSAVDIDRRSGDISSSVFFKAYDRNNITSRDPLIGIQDSTADIKQQMDLFAGSGSMSRWVRVYFEDQKRENLDAVSANLSNTSLRESLGIDFNDYVFDVRAQGVEYYIDGLEPMGCTRK
ncbi:MAG: hypothetical protein EBR09_07055 [Proteobacteria bacterium]|nr:hypothetical protein [Pseudomonadota bacterium]